MVVKWLLFLIILIVALSGCTGKKNAENLSVTQTVTATPTPTPPFPVKEPSTVYVEIFGSKFIPDELNVVKGTTVQWKNMDDAEHVLGGNGFESPPLEQRETWNYTFNDTGTFEYNCTKRPLMTRGRIIVR